MCLINLLMGWYVVRDVELLCCSVLVMYVLRVGGY